VPKVSVIIPAYQYGHFLGEAVDSVLAQTYKDYELIVVDDGSTDQTREVAAAYGDRTRYIYQDNRGLSAARNTGVAASKGEYVGFLDADDVWLPNKLEVEVQFLDTHTSVGLVYSNYTYFGSRGDPRRRGFDGDPLVSVYAPKGQFPNNFVSSSAVMVRKRCFEKVGLFDEALRTAGDLDMWLRMATCFEIGYINTPLSKYRLHERNVVHEEGEKALTEIIAVRRKFVEVNGSQFNKTSSKKLHKYYYVFYRLLGEWYLISGAPDKARGKLGEYIKFYPQDSFAYLLWLMTFLHPRLISLVRTCKQKLAPWKRAYLQAETRK
jgi:glycosyltransferase involved in cell wall biosynthesis